MASKGMSVVEAGVEEEEDTPKQSHSDILLALTTQAEAKGEAVNGKWRLNIKDGKRCILDCNEGYSPNGCHIIRNDGYGDWNHNVSSCVKDEWLNSKQLKCYGAIAGIIAASPLLLKAVGFGTLGVTAGSLAAKWMAYIGIVSKGSAFAWLQSMGMAGLGNAKLASIFASAGGVCSGIIDLFSEIPCESE